MNRCRRSSAILDLDPMQRNANQKAKLLCRILIFRPQTLSDGPLSGAVFASG